MSGTPSPVRYAASDQFCYLLLVSPRSIESPLIQSCYLVSNKTNGYFYPALETWFQEQLFVWHHILATCSPMDSPQPTCRKPDRHMFPRLHSSCLWAFIWNLIDCMVDQSGLKTNYEVVPSCLGRHTYCNLFWITTLRLLFGSIFQNIRGWHESKWLDIKVCGMDTIAANHFKQSVLLLFGGNKAYILSRREGCQPVPINVNRFLPFAVW